MRLSFDCLLYIPKGDAFKWIHLRFFIIDLIMVMLTYGRVTIVWDTLPSMSATSPVYLCYALGVVGWGDEMF